MKNLLKFKKTCSKQLRFFLKKNFVYRIILKKQSSNILIKPSLFMSRERYFQMQPTKSRASAMFTFMDVIHLFPSLFIN